ncbi:porin [Persephonella sp.]
MKKYFILIFILLFTTGKSFSLPEFRYDDGKYIKFFQMVQIWDVYTVKNEPAGSNINSRNDIYIRRGRIGAKGKIYDNLYFYTVFAFDNIGKNEFSASTGSPNTTAGSGTDGTDNRDFYLWDLFFTWKVTGDLVNITFGYFRPQIGRESITSAFNVISFQKGLSNFNFRKHLIGRSSGRETGINIGGLKNWDLFGINYNLGFFDTNSVKISGNTNTSKVESVGDGKKWSGLITFRTSVSFGDPEMDKYTLSYKQTYFGSRNGITVGLNYSYQGKTDLFDRNEVKSIDLLLNYQNLDFVFEYDLMIRETGSVRTEDKILLAKLGLIKKLTTSEAIQLTFMFSEEEPDNKNLTALVSQKLYDIGLNYFFNSFRWKLNLHYVWGEKAYKKFSYIGAGIQLSY